MILSKHFKDPNSYKLVRLIEDHSYTFDRNFNKLKLKDLHEHNNVYLLWANQIKILIDTYWITREEQIQIILQRAEQ